MRRWLILFTVVCTVFGVLFLVLGVIFNQLAWIVGGTALIVTAVVFAVQARRKQTAEDVTDNDERQY